MGIIRERRLNCRLYADRRADAEVLKKLDRLIDERHFLNQTELIKRGIELAYEEVYGQEKVIQNAVMSEEEVKVLAEAVAGELKSEIQQIVAECGASILAKVSAIKANAGGVAADGDSSGGNASREGNSYAPEAVVNTNTQVEKERESDEANAPALPVGAFGFLQRLNDD